MADNYNRNSFVITSPDRVLLYSRFGFKTVGEVWTEYDTFTSMFRESRPLIEKYARQEKQTRFVNI
jgi:hypothetical protein